MKYDFLKPLEVKTEEQVELLAKILSNPTRVIKLDKTPEEQESLDKVVSAIKGMSSIDEETVDIIDKAIQKNAVYLQAESFYDKEKSKQDRLKHKEFLKDVKHAQKSLVKLAKEYAPFDFQYTLDLFIQGIYNMREYYARGYCVMADDSQDPLTRLQMCDEIIEAYVDFIECIDPFTEQKLWSNLCDKIKAHLLYLWD